jgi:OOP family OmpA-OmpF porin
MYKNFLLCSFLFLVHFIYAQQTDKSKIIKPDTSLKDLNKWSVELNFGQNVALRPFSEGYSSSNSGSNLFDFSGSNHVGLGARYMFSQYFGLKSAFSYDLFKNFKESSSLPFETKSYSLSLEAYFNLGRLLTFETFSERFSLLAHGGFQYSMLYVDSPEFGTSNEKLGSFLFGISPQFKLSDKLSLNADISYLASIRQHLTWNGEKSPSSENLTGAYYQYSIGVSYYIGDKKDHLDWCTMSWQESELVSLQNRLDELETMLKDSDHDGVPDYLDIEKGTALGATVNTKGQTIQIEQIEPEERSLIGFVDSPEIGIQQLKEQGRLSLYFDLNNATLTDQSETNLFYIVQLLQRYPDLLVELTGYTDATGNASINTKLSLRRAQRLRQLLIKNFVNPDNITALGGGIYPDSTVPNSRSRRVDIVIRIP